MSLTGLSPEPRPLPPSVPPEHSIQSGGLENREDDLGEAIERVSSHAEVWRWRDMRGLGTEKLAKEGTWMRGILETLNQRAPPITRSILGLLTSH